MISERELLGAVSGIRRERLYVWIERGWLTPDRENDGWLFREIDVARVRLIHELIEDLAIGEDAMDVVLPLLDQVHGLRRELRRLANAIDAQPGDVQTRILRSLNADD